MSRYIIAYGASATVFFIIDYIWLAHVARRFYADRLGELLLERPNLTAAALFYAIYVAGIVIFAVNPAMKSGTVATAAIYGALFGFFAYATYDMTNFATLKNWPVSVAIVDIAWGTALTCASAVMGYLITAQLAEI
ncbi:MAG: DUF2177 family protein [Rhizobiaceae bacterium]